MSTFIDERNKFLEEIKSKLDLRGIEKFPTAVVVEAPYVYLSAIIDKDNIEKIDLYLENNVSIILSPFYYEGEDFLVEEINEYLTKKFGLTVSIKLFPKESIQSVVGIIADRSINNLTLNFSFNNFKSFEELLEFSFKLVKEFENFVNKKGTIMFNNNSKIIKKINKHILRL